jgi:GT2 family glycosyltransferase
MKQAKSPMTITPPTKNGSTHSCRATIIIPAYNRCGDVCALLDSLQTDTLDRRNVEVIVVDDHSTDKTVQTVSSRYPEVRLMVNDINSGPAYSRNVASRAARGRMLIYLDSDGVVKEGWLEQMLSHDHPNTILLGNAMDYEGGRVQSLPRRATFIGKSLQCSPNRANTGPSCNLGVPRECFRALDGFDEDIPYYFEDSDFCIRARKAGFGFCYLPEAIFLHKGNEYKQGVAIRHQEHNSTFAMLKAYRRNPFKLTAFLLLNNLWLLLRITVWSARGRFKDTGHLIRGATTAHARFFKRTNHRHSEGII